MTLMDFLTTLFGRREGDVTDTQRSPPTQLDTSAYVVIDALAKRQIAEDALFEADRQLAESLRQWAKRPVQLILSVPGAPTVTSPSPTPVNDVSFVIEVQTALDAAGEFVSDAGPFTWSAQPSGAASFSPDPAAADDTSKQTVNVTPADVSGQQADFMVTATDQSGVTGSLACHPTPGGPSRLVLGVGNA